MFSIPSAPYDTSWSFISVKLAPSACNIPIPTSFVALPPIPTISFLHPLRTASNIISPTPYVVVLSGFLCDTGTNVSPAACAISRIAVFSSPVPKMVYFACTFSPSGPVTVMH